MSNSTCPPALPPDKKFEKITDILNASGANQECKSILNTAVDAGMTKKDITTTVLGGLLGSNNTSLTDSQNHMRESLSKAGCSDLFVNISQQMNSTQSILCEVSNTSSTTSLSGSANASIHIVQGEPSSEMLAMRTAALMHLIVPIRPIQPRPLVIPPGASLEVSTAMNAVFDRNIKLYDIAMKNYTEALKIHNEELDSIMGNTTIRRTDFKNHARVDMKVISNMSSISTTAIAEKYEQIAKASAMNELINKTGLGANSDTVKSVVNQKIRNQYQNITRNIKNKLQDVELSAASDSRVVIIYYNSLIIEDVTFDQYAQARLITQNIVSSASNLGKTIALDMLTEGHTVTKSDKKATGQDKVFKELFDGQVALSDANAEGAAKLVKGVTDGMKILTDSVTGIFSGIANMFILGPIIIGVVVLLFFPQVANIIAPGPLKYVLAAVMLYFIVAWFVNFWPFSKSEKKLHENENENENNEFTPDEFKGSSPLPTYVNNIPSQKGASRGGDMMFT